MRFSSRTLHGVTALLLAALACTASGRAAGRKPGILCRESASAKASPLSVDRIFSGKEFDEERLRLFHWSNRTSDYFTLDGPAGGGKARNLVRNDPATGKKEVVVPAEALIPPGGTVPLTVDDFEFSADESKVLIYTNSKRVWRQNTRGDYWYVDLGTHRLQKLGGDAAASTLMFARLSPDGTRVAYVHENNLYVQQLRDMRITALTTDGSGSIVNGTADWANEEELDIRDGFRWSPDGREIVFWQFDTTGVRRFHLLKGTENGYPQVLSFPYPKVGETNSATRLGVVSATGGPVRWLDVPGDPRDHYLPHAEWTRGGAEILLQQFNRLQNTNRVMLANPKTGMTHPVLTETDAAWLENDNPVRWGGRGRDFLWLSDRGGWRHAYLADVDGKRFSRVTEGDYDVIGIEAVDTADGWLYYAASPRNPTQRYLYRTRLDGGKPERLSPASQPGWHTYHFSPNTHWAVHTYSTFTTPPVMQLVRLPQHQVVRVLADNRKLRERLAALRKPSAEFLRLDIGEGTVLDAWCLKPPDFDSEKKYPLLFHVYGEPQGQTVRDVWQGQGGLWHWMLAQQGCLVASVDNRGTMAPRGRAWRKAAYRQIGILAPRDQAAAVHALLQQWPFADARRVGIWGWSGGGSMSLNAIFRYPEIYSTAIAVAPNASQLLYDTIYQERYMGLPKDNVEGYRDGSPLTHAHRLQGNLLVVHGTADDNGHYLGTEMLIDELVAHNKHFTVMPYPSRSHSINEGTNTTRHLYGLLTRYLNEHLLESGSQPAPGPTIQNTMRVMNKHSIQADRSPQNH
jgi:dipeptidyl-peptidase 4